MAYQRKPLYRKVNTRARGVVHRTGGQYRDIRNTKSERGSDQNLGSMGARIDRGLDYTPLFRFLLASIGRSWNEVRSEALGRLDREEPLYWLVALHGDASRDVVRIGQNSYYSGLFVDEAGLLQVVDPSITSASLTPSCSCCTHTFNGVRFGEGEPAR